MFIEVQPAQAGKARTAQVPGHGQRLFQTLLAGCAALSSLPAAAGSLTDWDGLAATSSTSTANTLVEQVQFNVSGIDSVTIFRGAGNFVTFLQVAPFAQVTAIDFDVNLTAFSPSLLSGLAVIFTNSAITVGVSSRPGFGNNAPGTESFVGGGDLIAQSLDFAVGGDGLLRLEFVEVFDDPGLSPDGRWNFGNLRFTVSAVPEPATYGLMGLGLAGLMRLTAVRRRARQP